MFNKDRHFLQPNTNSPNQNISVIKIDNSPNQNIIGVIGIARSPNQNVSVIGIANSLKQNKGVTCIGIANSPYLNMSGKG